MSAVGGTSRFVVDASVAIKWFVPEIHASSASRLLDAEGELHAPDLLYPEVGNILWKKVRRGELTEDEGREIIRGLGQVPMVVHPSPPLLDAAFEIAVRAGRTVYDSLYVALAVRLQARLVTADEKLFNAVREGVLGEFVHWVDDL